MDREDFCSSTSGAADTVEKRGVALLVACASSSTPGAKKPAGTSRFRGAGAEEPVGASVVSPPLARLAAGACSATGTLGLGLGARGLRPSMARKSSFPFAPGVSAVSSTCSSALSSSTGSSVGLDAASAGFTGGLACGAGSELSRECLAPESASSMRGRLTGCVSSFSSLGTSLASTRICILERSCLALARGGGSPRPLLTEGRGAAAGAAGAAGDGAAVPVSCGASARSSSESESDPYAATSDALIVASAGGSGGRPVAAISPPAIRDCLAYESAAECFVRVRRSQQGGTKWADFPAVGKILGENATQRPA